MQVRVVVKALAVYAVAVLGSLCLFILGSSAVGYLAYSDRPGPGWYGSGWHGISAELLLFVASLALFGLPSVVLAGAILYGYVRALEAVRFPPAAVRIVGAISAVLVTAGTVSGIGWYIALDGIATYLPVLAGTVVVCLQFPRRRSTARHVGRTFLEHSLAGFRIVGSVLLGLLPLGLFLFGVCNLRGPVRWEIPFDYTGWVHIVFEQPDCPALELHEVTLLVPIDERGCGCTSSPSPWKEARSHEFAYVLSDGTHLQLERKTSIHHEASGDVLLAAANDDAGASPRPRRRIPKAEFFIGTREEAAVAHGNPRYYHEQPCLRLSS
jgi:hypothetical protein